MGGESLVHNLLTERKLADHLPERIVIRNETMRSGLPVTPEHDTKFTRHGLEPCKASGASLH